MLCFLAVFICGQDHNTAQLVRWGRVAALVTGSLVQMFQPPPGTSKQPPRTLSAPIAHPQPGFEMLQRKEAISQGLVMAPAGGCGLMGVCGCTRPAALHRDAAPSPSCWTAISGDGNKGKRGSVAVLRVWGVQVGWFTTVVLRDAVALSKQHGK